MSYNGSGVYTLPGAQLATGATVSATENNQFRNDVAAALNTAWTRDGQAPATNDIPMGGNKLVDVADPTTAGDALVFGGSASVNDLIVAGDASVTGDQTITGNQTVTGNQTITGNLSVSGQNIPVYGIGKNRIVNGGMVIDQRHSGSSVTPGNFDYSVDRFNCILSQASKYSVQQNAGSVTPPTGFTNYLGATSLSAYSVTSTDYFALQQPIEGYNVADLAWGTASASAVTLSFWVRSSLTGTFGGSIYNAAANRCYPYSYTISSANTWEQKTITIPGDTSGTWPKDYTAGIYITWGLGAGASVSGTAGSWGSTLYRSATGATSVVGTSGATFYITGVQLEKGSTATPFEYRPYGTEFALCQRYYETSSTNSLFWSGNCVNTVNYLVSERYSVTKRASPTVTLVNKGSSSGFNANNAAVSDGSVDAFYINNTATSSVDGAWYYASWTASAEL